MTAALVTLTGPIASGKNSVAAHQAHGALVAQWVVSDVDLVISVGPIYSRAERDALFGRLPVGTQPLRVLIDAPLAVTWQRVQADQTRGLSRQREFHEAAHARFRSLMPEIPADLRFDSGDTGAADIAQEIHHAIGLSRPLPGE